MSSKIALVAAVAATACISTTHAWSNPNMASLDRIGVFEETHWDPPSFRPLDEESAQDLKSGLQKAADILIKARELGLLEEDMIESQGLGKTLKKAANVITKAQAIGLLEEDEWTVNAGISGQGGSRPSWNVGVSHSWDEEQEQKVNWDKVIKVATLVKDIHDSGIFEEEGDEGDEASEEMKWKGWKKLENLVKKSIPVVIEAKKVGLFDEDEWTVNAGISGQGGGKPSWNVGVSHSWDGEQEQEQKWKGWRRLEKAAKKAVPIALALLEEDEWTVNAGISGQGGSKPSWNVGVSHSWDEDELEQKWKGWKKIENAVKKAIPVVIEAKKVGLFDQDEAITTTTTTTTTTKPHFPKHKKFKNRPYPIKRQPKVEQ